MVSAGNSQRNRSAASECQEELDNAVIPLRTTRRSPENRPLHLTKYSTCSTSTRKGIASLSCTPTIENGLESPVSLPDRSLRRQRMKDTRRRGEVNKRQMINTTSLRSPRSQDTSHHTLHRTHLQTHPSPPLTTRRHVENHNPSLPKHPTSSSSTQEESGASFMYAPG